MGRGRQKAKQTKKARELKYHTSSIDVGALQRELSGDRDDPLVDDEDDEYDDDGSYDEDDEDEHAAYVTHSRSG